MINSHINPPQSRIANHRKVFAQHSLPQHLCSSAASLSLPPQPFRVGPAIQHLNLPSVSPKLMDLKQLLGKKDAHISNQFIHTEVVTGRFRLIGKVFTFTKCLPFDEFLIQCQVFEMGCFQRRSFPRPQKKPAPQDRSLENCGFTSGNMNSAVQTISSVTLNSELVLLSSLTTAVLNFTQPLI